MDINFNKLIVNGGSTMRRQKLRLVNRTPRTATSVEDDKILARMLGLQHTDRKEFILCEYNSLRDELMLRLELRDQRLAFALTVVGVFLALGLSKDVMPLNGLRDISPTVFLVCPLLISCLAIGWWHHFLRIRQLSAYILHLETQTDMFGWARFMIDSTTNRRHLSMINMMAVGLVFIASQGVPIFIAWSRSAVFDRIDQLLFVLSGACLCITIAAWIILIGKVYRTNGV